MAYSQNCSQNGEYDSEFISRIKLVLLSMCAFLEAAWFVRIHFVSVIRRKQISRLAIQITKFSGQKLISTNILAWRRLRTWTWSMWCTYLRAVGTWWFVKFVCYDWMQVPLPRHGQVSNPFAWQLQRYRPTKWDRIHVAVLCARPATLERH